MSIKVIFLDIDGVVNSYNTKERAPSRVVGVEQCLIARIKEIVDATGAKLVLSSTWREGWFYEDSRDPRDWHYLRDEFAKQGLYFIDHTPLERSRHRGTEIKMWLESVEYDIDSYVIIDDEMYDIWEMHEGHMVKTSFNDGIQPGAVKMAIDILAKEDNPYGDVL